VLAAGADEKPQPPENAMTGKIIVKLSIFA